LTLLQLLTNCHKTHNGLRTLECTNSTRYLESRHISCLSIMPKLRVTTQQDRHWGRLTTPYFRFRTLILSSLWLLQTTQHMRPWELQLQVCNTPENWRKFPKQSGSNKRKPFSCKQTEPLHHEINGQIPWPFKSLPNTEMPTVVSLQRSDGYDTLSPTCLWVSENLDPLYSM